jgi:TonB-like protein
MRSNVASVALAAAFVLAPAVGGYAPALSQDFSITNKEQAAGDWTRKLQDWWNVHAWYPEEALEKKEAGAVKLHLVILQDGQVWMEDKVQGSGSKSIDDAGFYAFHGAHLLPFPPGTSPSQTDVNLTLHFVLEHRPSKTPFTIGNDPVGGTVVDTMLERTCTGTVEPLWGWSSGPYRVTTTWYHRPDGTKWVKFYYNGVGPSL